MKDSGYSWINDIPNDWDIVRVKDCFIQKNEKARQLDPVVLSLARDGVKVRDITTNEGQLAASYFNYNPVEPGDMMINPMDLYSGANCSLSKVSGVISPAYVNLKHKENIEPKFYDYYFKHQYWSMAFFAHGKGVSYDNRWTLNNDTIMKYPLVKPIYKEQIKIANYLDSKCSEINNLSKDIEHQIEILEEYKKSVITETVTKGTNPNVKMMNSKNIYIGVIPSHWNITRIKYFSKIKGRIGFRGYTEKDLVNEGEGAITLSPSNFNNMKMDYKKCSYISWYKYNESPEIMIKNGDILFVKTGSTYGKSCYVCDLPMEATINPQIIVFKNITNNPKWFSYYLQSSLINLQTEYAVVGGTIPTMSQEKIGNFFIAEPSISEQKEIAKYLDKKCDEIDSIILDKKKQLNVLAEYNKSLIYEYITGKKEVA